MEVMINEIRKRAGLVIDISYVTLLVRSICKVVLSCGGRTGRWSEQILGAMLHDLGLG